MTIIEFISKCDFGKVEYEVSPEVYFAFQRCSKDYNPLHTDTYYANNQGFSDCVMYGNILNAFVSHFVGMTLPSRDVMIQSQDISYHRPVYMNDRLELQYTIDHVSEAVNSITYKLKFYRLQNQKTELVAKGHVSVGLLEGGKNGIKNGE